MQIDVPETHAGRSLRSLRRTTWIHGGIVLLAAVLCWSGGQQQNRVAALPPDVDTTSLTFPVRIGETIVSSAPELDARIGAVGVGESIELVQADGHVVSVDATERLYSPWHIWITRVNGLFFLAVSLLVFASRVHVVPGRDLFWACLLYGLAVMIGGVHAPHALDTVGLLLPILRIVALAALPVLLLHVGLTFPRRSSLLERMPWLFPSIVAAAAILVVWEATVWIRWFTAGAGGWDAVVPARRAAGVFLAVVFGAGCLGLVVGGRQSRSDREREQVKWVLLGIALGAMPYVFLHALPRALELSFVLPVAAARMFSVVIPVAFSFAVIRHKFLDVDIIIRRSLIYLVLASLMVGVYSLLGIFVGNRIVERWPPAAPYVPIVATLVAALLFNPTRRAIARVIDRVFFKLQLESTQALAGFRREIAACGDQRDLATCFLEFLDRELGPRPVVVVLLHHERVFRAGDALPLGSTAPIGKSAPPILALPGATARVPIESEKFPATWAKAGHVVAHRIDTEEDTLGYVVLGAKRNERRYLAEELDLLARACREVAIRLKRTNLEQEIVDEIVARRRTEEMSRFRTDFFAQFAHDLRSPLTSISWSARNLLDGVVGPVTAAQGEYLNGIEGSARQLVRLVNNLLETTRLESMGAEIDLAPLSLGEVVEESVTRLRVTAGAKRVELRMHEDTVPAVLGQREKLLEVIDNLLENAIRYAPPESTVDVTLEREDDHVVLEFGDRGPGLGEVDVETLFEPYRQGTPSPHSTQHGFGLGLFVVRSWVERMGGTAEGANRDDGGAVFSIRLPIADATPKEADA